MTLKETPDLAIVCHAAITMNPQREIITDAGLAIKEGQIIFIGKAADMATQYEAAEKIDAHQMVALPGLIDCHLHSAQTLLRGLADDVGWFPYLRDYIWPLQGGYTAEDAAASLDLTLLETIKNGTTTFVDPLVHSRYDFDNLAAIVERSGSRAVLAKIVMDLYAKAASAGVIASGMLETRERSFQDVGEKVRRWQGAAGGRLKVFLGPRVPRPEAEACSSEFYKEVAALSRDMEIGVTVHLAGERDDQPYFARQYGLSPVEFLAKVGLLGPQILLAMCCWLSKDDVELLAKTGTKVVHCPTANMKMASGVAPVADMLATGVDVALGTDSAANNNSLDLWQEMKMASLLQNIHLLDPRALVAETALEMATINGAKALGWSDSIGSLEAGKRADIILVNIDQPHLIPSHDLVSNLVYAVRGSDVDTVIVDGRLLMRHRVVLTLDEEKIMANAHEAARRVTVRAGILATPDWPVK